LFAVLDRSAPLREAELGSKWSSPTDETERNAVLPEPMYLHMQDKLQTNFKEQSGKPLRKTKAATNCLK
jgi:hypothetical protein